MAAIDEALRESKGAEYWRCALQVNPYEYCVKYRGGAPTASEAEYNEGIVEACQREGIQVVGIADHGSVEHIDSLREALEASGIIVFPGFEISSTEHIHMVCLFEPGTSKDSLNQILGHLLPPAPRGGDTSPTRASTKACLEIARQVFEVGGVWYAAHMTGQNGLLRLTGAGDNFTEIWRDSSLVLAGQIPGGLDGLTVPQDELDAASDKNMVLKKYREIIENKNPSYERDRPITILNAKDVCGPDDVGHPSASCRIKMTAPTAEALKQAFLDPESRVRLLSEIDDERYAQLVAAAWTGGYLDGLRIHFSENLNTLIGGRGTGKSTVIETIRYAMGLTPSSRDAEKIHLEIVKDNLGNGGSIELLVRSRKHMGKLFRVTRRYGEPAEVRGNDNLPSRLVPRDLLPDLQILGQNEILDIANDDSAIKDLLHSLLPDTQEIVEKLEGLKQDLAENRLELVQARERLDVTEGTIGELPKLEEQIQHYNELGLEQKLESATLLNKEVRLVGEVDGYVVEAISALSDLKDTLEPDVTGLADAELESLPGKEFLIKIREQLESFSKDAAPLVEKLQERINTLVGALEAIEADRKTNAESVKKDLADAIAGLPDSAGKKGEEIGREFLALVAKRDEILPLKEALESQKKDVKALEDKRFELLSNWREAQNEQFELLRRGSKRLHKRHLTGKLQIDVVQWGNREPLKSFLTALPGIGERKVTWVDKVDSLSVATLVEKIREGNGSLRSEFGSAGMTPALAETLTKLSGGKLLELEEVELPPKVELKLNVSDQSEVYRPINKLSTGQKCTAILHLLLLEGHEPLIVDQPEDNLDNAFIAARIVTELRRAKQKRQFIFSTHNANIPVFGDSEWIGALQEEDGCGVLSNDSVGSIDTNSVRKLVSHILEGGREAFEIRRAKYGY